MWSHTQQLVLCWQLALLTLTDCPLKRSGCGSGRQANRNSLSPYRPDVHLLAVVAAAQQQLGRAVPACADVVCDADLSGVGGKLAGKAKVTQLQLANTGPGGTCTSISTGAASVASTQQHGRQLSCCLERSYSGSHCKPAAAADHMQGAPELINRFSGLMSLCTASWLWIQLTACTS